MRYRIVGVLMVVSLLIGTVAQAANLSDNGNGTVTDSRTGLVWQQGEPGAKGWGNALSYCEGLSLGGRDDWRLPNIKELESLTDEARYSPAIDKTYFPNAVASGYWSSTTNAVNRDSASYVGFYDGGVGSSDKSLSSYFRCVRGGQSGSLGSLSISDASGYSLGTQAAGVPFAIRVTGYSSSGAALTGRAYLYGSLGMIAPNWVDLTNGVGTTSVWLDSPGTGQTISASIQGVYGSSSPFDVSGSGGSQAKLSGTVYDSDGNKVAGATVALGTSTTTNLHATTSGMDGMYSFSTATPGKAYFVQATTTSGDRSGQLTVDLSNKKPVTMDLVVKSSNCNPDGLTPILLVPGIMGSTYYSAGMYPLLPAKAPEADYEKWHGWLGSWQYGLHDPLTLSGWRDLINGFKAQGYKIGCTLFPVPYDWRKPIDEIAYDYLEKAIDRAKRDAGTQKVNVIAHSMGGLVTRAYIERIDRNNNIDRFAMVGTPNHGSANAYYLWQGGDPRTLDDLTDGSYFTATGQINRDLKFYETTIGLNYAKMKKWPLLFYSTSKIRDFIREDVQSARQLMPTYTFLQDASHSFSLQNDKNTWLINLNNATNDVNYFAGKGITAKLYSGDDTSTISMVKVGDPNNSYADGKPKSVYTLSSGDGTVLKTSVDLPGLAPVPTSGTHFSLIGKFKDQLITFMTSSAFGASARFSGMAAAPQAPAAPITSTLGILVQGRVSPLLTDPTGKKSGINLTTGIQENEITDATISADMESAGISIENVADGTYTLTVNGEDAEDSWITVSYMDVDSNEERRLHHFNHAVQVSFTITVNSASAQKLTVTRLPELPANLQADVVGTTSLLTKLSWSAVTTPGVTGYNIYSRRDDAPFLTSIGTTTGTTFDTTHPWAFNDTVMSHLYAVTAIKDDGTESFLSGMAENNDRDHDGLTDAEELNVGTDPTKADTDGDGFSDFLEFQNGSNPMDNLSVPMTWLSVTPSGPGGGSLHSNPSGISCSFPPVDGINSWDFPMNSSVALTATLDNLSLFGSWTGCNSIGSNGECNITMSTSKSVAAAFVLAPKAKIGTTGYSLLSDAYLAPGSILEILSLDDVLAGDFTLYQDKAIKLMGGWNAAYLARSGQTVINGKLTIQKGSLRVNGVIVRP